MLAWVHQTTASEHEFLESLFGVKQRRRMMGQARRFTAGDAKPAEVNDEDSGEKQSEEEVEEALVRECMDKDLDGLGRPLKVSQGDQLGRHAVRLADVQLRIQQTIKSQEGLIVIYKITNLLQFYLITMRRTIGEKAALCRTIEE
jgi:hypothetical protein